jgi:hypothetical protein
VQLHGNGGDEMTDEQLVVIETRLKFGYVNVGRTRSVINGLMAIVVQKGRHVMVINSLGYDEYSGGSIILEDV